MKGIRERLFAVFQVEHAEHLQFIRSILPLLEQVEGASGVSEHLDEAFRRAHSLKGAARAVEIAPVEGLAHHLETLFSRVREGTLRLDRQASGVVSKVLDASEDCLASWSGSETTARPLAALHAIERLLGIASQEAVEESPAEQQAAPVPASIEPQSPDTLRVSGTDLDRLLGTAGQIVTESRRQNAATEEVKETSRQIVELARSWELLRKASAKGRGAAEEIHPMEAFNQRMRSLLSQSRKTHLLQQRSVYAIGHLARQLQQDAWSARLTPAWSFVEGFGKMVRDLAREQGKEISFHVTGGEVRADRMVLQRLKDPIMHLLRNAVSHGLEPPKERLAQGKEASGSLRLDIHCERRNLVVTVEDDGRGVDLERVSEVALERNLISEAELACATPRQISRLIFAPSFSTTREVTGLSGRGMGLSVVHESAKSLQGDVELTNPGQAGTSIALTVPLSMSTTHVVLVSVAGSTFGIPSPGIVRLFEIPSQHLAAVQGKPSVNLNGQQHRLFSLAQLLGFDPADSERMFHGERLAVVLLRAGSRRAAVLVDGYAGEKDVLIQSLGIASLSHGHVTGGAILDDATIALTLNAAGLVDACEQPDAPPMPSVKFRPKRAPASILVVDDSITTRSLEKSILETSGYRVRVAVDGIEALELLRIELSDLVITDVQMPRMDGLSLVAAIKADPRLQRIPVIMVSSLGNEEDQERGLANGADVYIVKQKFDQRQLLDAVEQSL